MEFGKLIRASQGEFRNASTTISNAAKNPHDQKGKNNSHLLAIGYEIENLYPGIRGQDQVLKLFTDRRIKWWKSARSGDDCSCVGPTRNMASSQIFCLNCWYPIKDDRKLLTAIIRLIEPSIEDVMVIQYKCFNSNNNVSSCVEFEWVGSHQTLEKRKYSRGANATSIDAFIVGFAGTVKIGFFFEWKLVEKYREQYLGRGPSGEVRKKTYQEYLESNNSVFSKLIPIDEILYEPFYQIFRMGLLGQKMIYEDKELDKVIIIPVFPRNNLAYLDGITSPSLRSRFSNFHTVSEVASQFFKEPVIYKSIFIDDMWNRVKSNAGVEHTEWIKYMDDRYFRNLVS